MVSKIYICLYLRQLGYLQFAALKMFRPIIFNTFFYNFFQGYHSR